MTTFHEHTDTVSVIIPVFNAAAWIRQTIDSILAQTIRVLEILVVDDGSTDNTADIVREYGSPVVYINQQHQGVSAARNRGIRTAKASLIAFIDGDDYWHQRKLEAQIGLMGQKDLQWVSCEIQPFDSDTGAFVDGLTSPVQNGDVLEALFLNNFIGSATPLVRRDVFDQVGLFNEAHEARIGEDWDMWLRIASIYPLGVVHERLAFLRLHGSSAMSSTSMNEKVKCLVGVVERAVERDSARLAPLKGKALAGIYYNAGVQSFKQGQYRQAYDYFLLGLKYRPLKIESWIYLLMIKSGPAFSRHMVNLKRFLTGQSRQLKKQKHERE
ncbi:UDP-Glc:alpha-D-GlcNAc-diphosphoundecaprenol beta-1,3-glucosyltransferase WfgD [Anaerolineales bacterium]|nr:UDP-Glc:alpha-D-GlcNAc-diphosphoundecaprenol beta-1,3-glucosyltransferase WfgD [Anaerolineales bacterium]